MFQVFVRFKVDMSEFALWPVMRDHRTKEVYTGTIGTPYPTTFTARSIGPVIARLYKKYQKGGQLDRVEVREAIDYDAKPQQDSGSGERGIAGYSEACGQYN